MMEKGNKDELFNLKKWSIETMERTAKGGFNFQVKEIPGKYFSCKSNELMESMFVDYTSGRPVEVTFSNEVPTWKRKG